MTPRVEVDVLGSGHIGDKVKRLNFIKNFLLSFGQKDPDYLDYIFELI